MPTTTIGTGPGAVDPTTLNIDVTTKGRLGRSAPGEVDAGDQTLDADEDVPTRDLTAWRDERHIIAISIATRRPIGHAGKRSRPGGLDNMRRSVTGLELAERLARRLSHAGALAGGVSLGAVHAAERAAAHREQQSINERFERLVRGLDDET